MKFHHPAVPIVLAILLIDSIGFGIVVPVLPGLVVHLGHVTLAEATRIAAILLAPYMPLTADRIMDQLGLASIGDGDWSKAAWGTAQLGTVDPQGLLFPRIEVE